MHTFGLGIMYSKGPQSQDTPGVIELVPAVLRALAALQFNTRMLSPAPVLRTHCQPTITFLQV